MKAALFVALALVAGCGWDMMGGSDHGAMDQGLASAREEVWLHHANVTGAMTMDAVRNELTRHGQAMATIHDRMRLEVARMGGCGGDMMDMMSSARAMEGMHATALGAANGLEQARIECDRYADEMTRLHDRMAYRCDGMDCM